jgi:hypothetical protein
MWRRFVRPALLGIALSASGVAAQESVYPTLTLSADDSETRRPSISRLQFQAYGRDFALSLQSNDRIKAGLAPATQARLGATRLYRGELDGYPGSWVRLTEHNGSISGVV